MAKPVAHYSPYVTYGNLIFVSGQIGLDTEGELVEGLKAQTKQSLSNLTAVLKSAGAGLNTVIKTTIYLADINDYAVVNEIYAAAMGKNRPARAAVAVAALPLGALVEIEAVAKLGNG